MELLERDPAVIWRKESGAEQAVREAMRRGEDASDRGVVTLVLSGMMHQLNLIGGRIWELADGTRDACGIAAALSAEFGWPAEQILPDVEEFAADMAAKGWLRRG